MEAAIRAAVQAEEPPPVKPPPRAQPEEPPLRGGDMGSLMREVLAGPRASSPAKLNLDTTIHTALTQQSALKKSAAGRKAAPRTRVAWLILFAVVALGGAAAIYVAGALDAPEPAVVASAPAPAPPPRLDQQQRAALDEIVNSLRQLQAASNPNAPTSVYMSRVGFAKADVDRFIGATAPGPERTAVREIIEVHMLAAAAWKARALDQKDSWEAVGQDPAIDLCPSIKRVVDFATQPQDVSRAQARGAAVASAIPLLWECAAAKIAALDRAPAAE